MSEFATLHKSVGIIGDSRPGSRSSSPQKKRPDAKRLEVQEADNFLRLPFAPINLVAPPQVLSTLLHPPASPSRPSGPLQPSHAALANQHKHTRAPVSPSHRPIKPTHHDHNLTLATQQLEMSQKMSSKQRKARRQLRQPVQMQSDIIAFQMHDDQENTQVPDNEPARKIFVGGIPWLTTDDAFEKFFRKFGTIVDALIVRDSQTGTSRGYGFLTFKEPEAAAAALKETIYMDGRKIDCKVAEPMVSRRGGEHVRKVFVGGLSRNVTSQILTQHFGKYGDILNAVVMVDRASGRSRGFGFVTFAQTDSVAAVMETPQLIGGKLVDCHKALSRQQMQKLTTKKEPTTKGAWVSPTSNSTARPRGAGRSHRTHQAFYQDHKNKNNHNQKHNHKQEEEPVSNHDQEQPQPPQVVEVPREQIHIPGAGAESKNQTPDHNQRGYMYQSHPNGSLNHQSHSLSSLPVRFTMTNMNPLSPGLMMPTAPTDSFHHSINGVNGLMIPIYDAPSWLAASP
eukprot:gb/GEZN01003764.1/.p1 GENE.gb/GEZN01003764.1/~~gb/GEZN01003764.1/.p1  ORF type:complete len:510 (+),score=56.23 gb/GEZN01003764.1/:180-1709(+)